MRNPVAKHSGKYNRASTHIDRKKESKLNPDLDMAEDERNHILDRVEAYMDAGFDCDDKEQAYEYFRLARELIETI